MYSQGGIRYQLDNFKGTPAQQGIRYGHTSDYKSSLPPADHAIKNAVRQAMQERNLRQVDIVREAGVNQSQLSQWLRGKHTTPALQTKLSVWLSKLGGYNAHSDATAMQKDPKPPAFGQQYGYQHQHQHQHPHQLQHQLQQHNFTQRIPYGHHMASGAISELWTHRSEVAKPPFDWDHNAAVVVPPWHPSDAGTSAGGGPLVLRAAMRELQATVDSGNGDGGAGGAGRGRGATGSSRSALIPVRLDVDLEGRRLRDALSWSATEHRCSPEVFAERLVADEELPACFAAAIAASIRRQIFSFLRAPPPPAGRGEDVRMICIDIQIGRVVYHDQFEWDIACAANCPEAFARTVCRDLQLPGPFEATIAHAIRDQSHPTPARAPLPSTAPLDLSARSARSSSSSSAHSSGIAGISNAHAHMALGAVRPPLPRVRPPPVIVSGAVPSAANDSSGGGGARRRDPIRSTVEAERAWQPVVAELKEDEWKQVEMRAAVLQRPVQQRPPVAASHEEMWRRGNMANMNNESKPGSVTRLRDEDGATLSAWPPSPRPKPPRSINPFLQFSKAKRKTLALMPEFRNKPTTVVSKHMGELWKKTTQEERSFYETQAAVGYKERLRQWHAELRLNSIRAWEAHEAERKHVIGEGFLDEIVSGGKAAARRDEAATAFVDSHSQKRQMNLKRQRQY